MVSKKEEGEVTLCLSTSNNQEAKARRPCSGHAVTTAPSATTQARPFLAPYAGCVQLAIHVSRRLRLRLPPPPPRSRRGGELPVAPLTLRAWQRRSRPVRRQVRPETSRAPKPRARQEQAVRGATGGSRRRRRRETWMASCTQPA
jgi:hypothetical protein